MRLGRRSPRVVDEDVFRRLLRARDRIEDAYAETLDLATLARDAGVAPFHFLRLFQRVFGATPHAYLTSVRMARAQELLARSATVTEACLRVGYLSLPSFSARFRDHVGRSPQAWQRHVRHVVGARAFRLHIPCCYLLLCTPKGKIGETGRLPAW